MLEFGYPSIPWSILGPLMNYCMRLWAFAWREALTETYLHRWRLSCGGAALQVESASQRIQEDTHQLAKGIDSIGRDAAMAVLEMCVFVPVLWRLAGGTLVLTCVGGNALGLLLSLVVGRKLVSLDYNNQRCEAAF